MDIHNPIFLSANIYIWIEYELTFKKSEVDRIRYNHMNSGMDLARFDQPIR